MKIELKKSATILGIDLRVNSVKLVELAEAKDGRRIINWALSEIPYALVDKHPQKEEAQIKELTRLIQEKNIKAKEAIVVVSGGEAHTKVIALSGVVPAELKEAIKWKFSDEVSYPVEEALVDFYPLLPDPAPGENQTYVASCLNRKTYEAIASVVKSAGLKLSAIVIVPDVLQEVYRQQIAQGKDQVVALIYMGKRTTNISILKAGRLAYNRELNIGGDNITQAMTGVLVSPEGRVEINAEQAEKIKTEFGVPIDLETYPKLGDLPVSQLQAMVRPALERIRDEIMRTFEYYEGQSGEAKVDKIFLTGGASTIPNLAVFLGQGLGISIETTLVVPEELYVGSISDQAAFEKAKHKLVTAIGAVLIADSKINLVPDEVKHHWQLVINRYFKPQYLLPAVAGLLVLFYFIFVGQAGCISRDLNETKQKVSQYQPVLLKLEALEQSVRAASSRKEGLSLKKQARSKLPAVFEELSFYIPSSVTIKSLNFKDKDNELRLSGLAFDGRKTAESLLSEFVLKLSESKYFREVRLVQAQKNTDYTQDALDFEIISRVSF